jgi:hypothetical protein
MKPVKAWRLVHVDGSGVGVYWTKKSANEFRCYGYRIARVEIREVTKRKAKR